MNLYSALKNSLQKFIPSNTINPVSKLSLEAWLGKLEQEKGAIEEYSTLINSKFNKHSKTLESLIEDIEDLKKDCQNVIDIISDEKGETPVQFSYQLFKKANDIINASFDQFRMIFDSVKVLRDQIQSVESSQEHLAKITVPLKMITIQYRITASMMDEATRQAFYDLSDKLSSLVLQINESIGEQFTNLSNTKMVCNTIIVDLEKMIATYENQIETHIGTSKSSLDNLGISLGNSQDLINDISECNNRLSEGVFSIMVAMQTQDMSSQKLEHVCAAIDSIRSRLKLEKNQDEKAALYFAKEAGKIQTNQLQSLFGDLETATQSIRLIAQTTENETEKMAEATQELSNVGQQHEMLSESGQCIKKILGFVESTIDKTQDVLTSLAPLRDKFTDSTKTVMNIAGEMRMVAINAQVYAASVSDGEALEVLSHSTQVQSNDTRKSIESISNSLESVASSLNSTEKQLSRFSEMGQTDLEELIAESEIARTELKRLEVELPKMLNHIQKSRNIVTEKTRAFAEVLNTDSSIKIKAENILNVFKEISTAEIGGINEEIILAERQNLSNLKSNYTMHSEVSTHDETTGEIGENPEKQPTFDTGEFDSFDDFSQESLNDEQTHLDSKNCETRNIKDDFSEFSSEKEERIDQYQPSSSKPKEVEKLDDNIDLF